MPTAQKPAALEETRDKILVPDVIKFSRNEPQVGVSGRPDHSFDADDDDVTVSTRTDDDPVNLAMKAVLPSDEEDDEEEQVLYPKQNLNPVYVYLWFKLMSF